MQLLRVVADDPRRLAECGGHPGAGRPAPASRAGSSHDRRPRPPATASGRRPSSGDRPGVPVPAAGDRRHRVAGRSPTSRPDAATATVASRRRSGSSGSTAPTTSGRPSGTTGRSPSARPTASPVGAVSATRSDPTRAPAARSCRRPSARCNRGQTVRSSRSANVARASSSPSRRGAGRRRGRRGGRRAPAGSPRVRPDPRLVGRQVLPQLRRLSASRWAKTPSRSPYCVDQLGRRLLPHPGDARAGCPTGRRAARPASGTWSGVTPVRSSMPASS